MTIAPDMRFKVKPAAPKPAEVSLRRPVALQNRVLATAAADTLALERVVLDNPTYRNKVTTHVTAEESREALLSSIRSAKSSFYIETYIWHNDEAGREVAQALIDRKKEVEAAGGTFDAKVLIDAIGLHDPSNAAADADIVDFMRKNGIEVRLFNKAVVNPLAAGNTPITHRKLYIQDGTQFISGGRNIGDEYLMTSFFSPKGQKEVAWHDLMYTVEGDETGRIINEFFKNWTRSGGTRPAVMPTIVPAIGGNARVQSFTTNPHENKTDIRDVHIKAIASAKSEIRVVYPYFSDDALVQALIDAKKANPKLQIKVLMPGKEDKGANAFLFGNLNEVTAGQLLEAGIDVRFVERHRVKGELVETYSHFKAMVIDGTLLSIGSANGDARTMAHNHELNTLIHDPVTARKFIDQVLEDDWNLARKVTLEEIDNRPWYRRLAGWVLEGLDFLL